MTELVRAKCPRWLRFLAAGLPALGYIAGVLWLTATWGGLALVVGSAAPVVFYAAMRVKLAGFDVIRRVDDARAQDKRKSAGPAPEPLGAMPPEVPPAW